MRALTTAAALSVALALGAGMTACSPAPENTAQTGYIEAEWLYVAAPAPGWITENSLHKGAFIDTGQLLFRLDDTAQRAGLAAAEAAIAEARARAEDLASGARAAEINVLKARLAESEAVRDEAGAELARVRPLVERGIETAARGDAVNASYRRAVAGVDAARENLTVAMLAARPAQREAATAAVAAAEAHRDDALWQLQQRDVRARVAGRVEEVFLEAGEYAVAGAPVVSILAAGALKARFFVAQSRLPELSAGDPVQVIADGLAQPVEANVSYISAQAEYTPPVIYSAHSRDKLVFLVEAQLPPGSGLHPGLPVEVRW